VSGGDCGGGNGGGGGRVMVCSGDEGLMVAVARGDGDGECVGVQEVLHIAMILISALLHLRALVMTDARTESATTSRPP
jgi:hypothetical protein